eukprot:5306885-Prymnesium_polylepis.1
MCPHGTSDHDGLVVLVRIAGRRHCPVLHHVEQWDHRLLRTRQIVAKRPAEDRDVSGTDRLIHCGGAEEPHVLAERPRTETHRHFVHLLHERQQLRVSVSAEELRRKGPEMVWRPPQASEAMSKQYNGRVRDGWEAASSLRRM